MILLINMYLSNYFHSLKSNLKFPRLQFLIKADECVSQFTVHFLNQTKQNESRCTLKQELHLLATYELTNYAI